MPRSFARPFAKCEVVAPALLTGLICVAAAWLQGCAPAVPESGPAGVIAQVEGAVRVLTPQEQTEICSTHFCEPNYRVQASFGRKRSPAPPPAPIPAPPPAPLPTPVPPVSPVVTQKLDYSRAILGVERAWALTRGSRAVTVAVIDTGVDYNHPDLNQNLVPGFGYDFLNGHVGAMDDNRHGTHCAGIIGAVNNDIGTVGISPLVSVLPLKFLDKEGSGTTADAISAVRYAISHGAQILSLSWGGGERSEFLNRAIQDAINAGITVVAAAGNESVDNDLMPSYPASYAGVLAVASTDENDALSSFSNVGARSVRIAAPGSHIFSTLPGGLYGVLSGTSMATPQVAGALALAKALRPSLGRQDLEAALCDSARKIHLDQVECGRMDVGAFLERVNGGE